MKIVVNGERREVTSANLQALLSEIGFGDAVVATARNGEFVAVACRANTSVCEDDRFEVLAPMQGG